MEQKLTVENGFHTQEMGEINTMIKSNHAQMQKLVVNERRIRKIKNKC
jgi:hypothetical protein